MILIDNELREELLSKNENAERCDDYDERSEHS